MDPERAWESSGPILPTSGLNIFWLAEGCRFVHDPHISCLADVIILEIGDPDNVMLVKNRHGPGVGKKISRAAAINMFEK